MAIVHSPSFSFFFYVLLSLLGIPSSSSASTTSASTSSASTTTVSTSSALALDRSIFPTITFDEGYLKVFGDGNLMLLEEGKMVHLSLNERTGSGFASQDLYLHGFFSASIKLPSDYAAGVVVAFYMSNGDVFEKTHDELDFEFLGNVRGREWRVQTNVYGNGSTSTGKEERYELGFDPTEDFHQYSILWSPDTIVFRIDSTPIREVRRSREMGGRFPSKPMSVYATIWDGSTWATSGGRYKVNYKHAPFVAKLTDLLLHGCAVDPLEHSSTCDELDGRRFDGFSLSPEERLAMKSFRKEHITYSYCYDRDRYSTVPTECVVDSVEAKRIRDVEFLHRRRRHHRGRRSRSHDHHSSLVAKE